MTCPDNNRIRALLPIRIGEGALCDFGYDNVARSHSYGPAVRNYTLMHFILDGEGTFYCGGETHRLSGGDCFLIKPDVVTTYTADSVNPWSYLWIGVRGAQFDSVISKAFGERITAAFDKSALEGVDPSVIVEQKPYSIALKVTSLLYELLASVYDTRSVCEPTRQPDVVRDAVRYIENNYFHPFDVSSLAHILGISRAHFTVLFSAAMGVSPYRYLLNYRLERATELLGRSPALTVEEIAYSVGFASVERFSEMFKKRYSLSPRAWREST